jgi:hypothetical protein
MQTLSQNNSRFPNAYSRGMSKDVHVSFADIPQYVHFGIPEEYDGVIILLDIDFMDHPYFKRNLFAIFQKLIQALPVLESLESDRIYINYETL